MADIMKLRELIEQVEDRSFANILSGYVQIYNYEGFTKILRDY